MLKEAAKSIFKSRVFIKGYIILKSTKKKIDKFLNAEVNNFYTAEVRNQIKSFGNGSKINGQVTLLIPEFIIIGNNVHIGSGCFFEGRGGLIIGDNTHISRNVTIYTSNHNYLGSVLPYDINHIGKEVIIEKNVWIGMNVSIAPGVHIGEGAIIGIGAIISKDVPPGAIVASPPQRIIGNRDETLYQANDDLKNYGGQNGISLEKVIVNNYTINAFGTKETVFVLSTGRAGSKTMAKLFEDNSNIAAFHETFYFILERMAIEYLTGKLDREKAKQKLIKMFESASFIQQGKIYLESDQKLVPFIGLLDEIFKKPKFIWLIRHPKTFMHSATVRGWYNEPMPKFVGNKVLLDFTESTHCTRITGNMTNQFSEEEWVALDQRAKVLWYWKYWNSMIEEGLKNIPQEQKLFIQLENLKHQYKEILEFLGMKGENYKEVPIANHVRKESKAAYVNQKIDNYSYFQTEGFKIIQNEMTRMGYSQ